VPGPDHRARLEPPRSARITHIRPGPTVRGSDHLRPDRTTGRPVSGPRTSHGLADRRSTHRVHREQSAVAQLPGVHIRMAGTDVPRIAIRISARRTDVSDGRIVGLFSDATGGPRSCACGPRSRFIRAVAGRIRQPSDSRLGAPTHRLATPIETDERAYARANTARGQPQAPTRGCVLFHAPYSMLVATPRNVVMVFAVPDDRSGTHRAARRILPPPRCVLNPVAGTGEPTPDAVPRDPGRIGHPPARPHECRAWA
jgi:hypothetical protein